MNFDEMRSHLEEILANTRMVTLLQPVLDLEETRVAGYEALSWGPSNSPLHAPQAMACVAEHHGMLAALDWARIRVALRTFSRLKLTGRLFVSLSPGSLLDPSFAPDAILEALAAAGMNRGQVVLGITEHFHVVPDCADLRQAVSQLYAEGIEVAIDDGGEELSSLHLWSGLKHSFVKIGQHFITDLHQDAHKIRMVCSIRHLAEGYHSCVIASGVESTAELAVLKNLGVRYAQGHLIGHPSLTPIRRLPGVEAFLLSHRSARSPWRGQGLITSNCACPASQIPWSCHCRFPSSGRAWSASLGGSPGMVLES